MSDKDSILVVDDTHASLKLLTDILTAEGYAVRPADSGTLALASVAANPPALILLDILMPEMDGFEVFRRLKTRPESRHIPVIFISASTEIEQRVEGLKLGAVDFITKPFQREELLARVQTHLELSRANVSLAQQAEALHQANAQLQSEIVRRQGVEAELHQSLDQAEHSRRAMLNALEDQQRTETALRYEKDFAEGLIETAPTIVLVLDPRGRIVRFNPYMEEISGYALAEVQGKDWFTTFLPESDRERIRTLFLKAASGLQTHGSVNPIMTKDGREREVEWYDKPLRDEQGNVTGLLAIGHDITERKQAEAQLQQSEARFRATFEQAAMGMAHVTLDGRWLRVNQKLCGILGYTREALLEKAFQEITYPEDLHKDLEALQQMRRGESENYSAEKRYIRKDGSLIWVNLTIACVRAPSGEPSYFISVTEDITVRKRTEAALLESKALIDAVVESVPLMIFIKEATDLRFVVFNRAGEELLGYDRQALLGKNNLDLFPPEQAAHFMAKDREVLDGEAGMLDIPEEPILTAKEGQRLLHTRKVCIRGADGTTKYLLGISEDITERKRTDEILQSYAAHLQTEVEQRTRELRAAQEQLVRHEKLAVLGQMAGSVGHELRNPLGVILNAIYYLKLLQPEAGPEVKEYLGLVEQETRTANKIITDLLGFARAGAADREAVSIPELLGQTLERYPVPPAVAVALELPADLPLVYADPQQMLQVLGNLTVNACQAMPEGGKLTLSATLQDGLISTRVQDTGVGISPENMEKLFEPLFTTKTKGIGLGLAVSQKLVEANGGRIEVESTPGQGSTFTVYLPVKP